MTITTMVLKVAENTARSVTEIRERGWSVARNMVMPSPTLVPSTIPAAVGMTSALYRISR